MGINYFRVLLEHNIILLVLTNIPTPSPLNKGSENAIPPYPPLLREVPQTGGLFRSYGPEKR